MMQTLIIDANVFFKILHQEFDSEIDLKGIFITADEKHFKKSHEFGSMLLLRDWEQLKP